MIRLASVCPPEAVRPHIQEGYLLGEYPEIADYEQKALYPHYEIDCRTSVDCEVLVSDRPVSGRTSTFQLLLRKRSIQTTK